MVASACAALLTALAAHGPQAGDVTDVVFVIITPITRSTPRCSPRRGSMITGPSTSGTGGSDGTLTGRSSAPRSGCCVPPGTPPGHYSTVASTPGEVFACTHASWGADGPADDPLGWTRRPARQPRTAALLRHGDRARSRSRVPPGPQHPALARVERQQRPFNRA